MIQRETKIIIRVIGFTSLILLKLLFAIIFTSNLWFVIKYEFIFSLYLTMILGSLFWAWLDVRELKKFIDKMKKED